MIDREKRELPSDELLVAFLDGELDGAEREKIEELIRTDEGVAERFDFLSRSSLPFARAYEPVLSAAPSASLQAMLANIPSPQMRRNTVFGAGRRSFLATAAAFLVVGVIGDRAYLGVQAQVGSSDGSEWRKVVAEYISLYTADTLSGPSPETAIQEEQLGHVGSRVGLSLSPQMVALPGVDFKRAQILQYDDQPLAQIAYLDPESGPMALCIVPSSRGRKDPDMENRKGMNVVYWSNDTHAFMLIGHRPIDGMMDLADAVRGHLSV